MQNAEVLLYALVNKTKNIELMYGPLGVSFAMKALCALRAKSAPPPPLELVYRFMFCSLLHADNKLKIKAYDGNRV